jgi:hypothetical protein
MAPKSNGSNCLTKMQGGVKVGHLIRIRGNRSPRLRYAYPNSGATPRQGTVCGTRQAAALSCCLATHDSQVTFRGETRERRVGHASRCARSRKARGLGFSPREKRPPSFRAASGRRACCENLVGGWGLSEGRRVKIRWGVTISMDPR